jgi:hypothetical protein
VRAFLSTAGAVTLLSLAFGAATVRAADFFVGPEGQPTGDGTQASPWDLATALGQPRVVKPGDTLWLRGGTYRGGFTSTLRGTRDAPITVRAVPGERVTVDCKPRDARDNGLFSVGGAWTNLAAHFTRLAGVPPADGDVEEPLRPEQQRLREGALPPLGFR